MDSATKCVLHGGYDWPIAPDRDRCRAAHQSGRDARGKTNGHYGDSLQRSLHGHFAEIIHIPWKFQQERVGEEKKFADWTLPGEKPGKTPVPDVQNRSKMHQSGVKTGQNGG